MPFGLHWPEIVLILVIVLLIFGAGKLRNVGRDLGKGIREFRKARTEDADDVESTNKEQDISKLSEAAETQNNS
jgi:TatA/E family protein of Tat protein translocase